MSINNLARRQPRPRLVRYHARMVVTARAILFDLDGVLVDSTPAITRVWERWALEQGFKPEKTVRESHGRPSLEVVRELLPDADHEVENLRIERMEMEDVDGVVPLPGALELLTSLPPDRWTIVTSCTRPLAEVRIRATGLPLPSTMVTASDIGNGKPHPEPYVKAARKLGVMPADCVAFEDVPAGIHSAKAAGARVFAAKTTTTESEILAARPDWIVENCAAVKAFFSATLGLIRLSFDGEQLAH